MTSQASCRGDPVIAIAASLLSLRGAKRRGNHRDDDLPVIANEVKQSIPAHHHPMDRFVPRDDDSPVIANEAMQSMPVHHRPNPSTRHETADSDACLQVVSNVN
jgi:hypothetical protein